ncbi:hypothetical protein RN001_002583 [Aquatica leii]|uniref:HTH myb-type domain-containing protein n=1 Tax=Aquatica leii TaxID=1421715 RepID=A0AAN7Q8R9_9COLE|nr:hypothetical protein RN001_002583 [Aquatica leii]
MWENIAELLQLELNIIRTPLQCENRLKTILKRKRVAVSNNSKSGNIREIVKFEDELNKIASLDDSVQPEVLRSANKCTVLKESKKKKLKSQLAETIWKIHLDKEQNRERRHKEKLEFLQALADKLAPQK